MTLGSGNSPGEESTFSGSITAGKNYSVYLDKIGSGTLTIGGSNDNVNLGATVESGLLILAKQSSADVHAIGSYLTIDSGPAFNSAAPADISSTTMSPSPTTEPSI